MAESNRQIEWNTKFAEVKQFSTTNNRWPSTTAENEVEKILGQWWSRQKYLLNKKLEGKPAPGISDEREAQLKGLIESNSTFERDGIWDTRYASVLAKFKADGKLWPYATTDVEQQKSIRWWNQQKTFARKFQTDPASVHGGMTQDRFNKVLALMKDLGQELESTSTEPPVNPSNP